MLKFSHLLTVRAEGADPPPFTVSLTVKRLFFLTTALNLCWLNICELWVLIKFKQEPREVALFPRSGSSNRTIPLQQTTRQIKIGFMQGIVFGMQL